jgi:uncharacterized RmlC-like cupin family protein
MTRNAAEQTHPALDDDLAAPQQHAPQQHALQQHALQPEVRVIRPEDFTAHTAQTAGMRRFAAISRTLVGAHGIWAGYTVIEPNVTTGLHHHGNQETIIYVKAGHAQVRWGAHRQQEALAPAGSLVYIPAFLPHQEINPSPETVAEWVIIRTGPEAIVVNLE